MLTLHLFFRRIPFRPDSSLPRYRPTYGLMVEIVWEIDQSSPMRCSRALRFSLYKAQPEFKAKNLKNMTVGRIMA